MEEWEEVADKNEERTPRELRGKAQGCDVVRTEKSL